MNVVPLFIPNTKASLIEQPVEGRFHNPAVLSQSTAVFGISLRNQRSDASGTQRLSNLLFGVVRAIRKGGCRVSCEDAPADGQWE